MIYIIDGSIAYNSDDCSLTHLPTQDSLSLSISSGRLFERLLTSNGEVLPRETLLTEVWDKYGLRGSNSNLNQYLSILRRALAAFGCENLIITLPKVGIRLNTEIPIVQTSAISEAVSDASDDVIAEPTAVDPKVSQPQSNPASRVWLYKTAILTILLGIIAWGWLTIAFDEEDISPVSVSLPGGCKALFVAGLDMGERESVIKQILQMLRENHQSCDASHRLYFDKNTSFNPQNYGRTILSSCKLNDSGHVISCDNFYYLDWRLD